MRCIEHPTRHDLHHRIRQYSNESKPYLPNIQCPGECDYQPAQANKSTSPGDTGDATDQCGGARSIGVALRYAAGHDTRVSYSGRQCAGVQGLRGRHVRDPSAVPVPPDDGLFRDRDQDAQDAGGLQRGSLHQLRLVHDLHPMDSLPAALPDHHQPVPALLPHLHLVLAKSHFGVGLHIWTEDVHMPVHPGAEHARGRDEAGSEQWHIFRNKKELHSCHGIWSVADPGFEVRGGPLFRN